MGKKGRRQPRKDWTLVAPTGEVAHYETIEALRAAVAPDEEPETQPEPTPRSDADTARVPPTMFTAVDRECETQSEPHVSTSDLSSPAAVSETLVSTLTPVPVRKRRSSARRWVAALSLAAGAMICVAFARSPSEAPIPSVAANEAPPPAAIPAAAPAPEPEPEPAPIVDTTTTTMATVPVSALPSVAPPPKPIEVTTSTKDLLRQAVGALRDRNYSVARQRYHLVLETEPGNVEAMNGLGDAALMTGDLRSAKQYYARAVKADPSHFPARLSLADTQWDLGERSAAQKQYADIAAQFPGRGPDRVQKRASTR